MDATIGNISEHKVMKSAAGYYIGQSYFDKEIGCDCPYDRHSGYYPTAKLAQQALDNNTYYR